MSNSPLVDYTLLSPNCGNNPGQAKRLYPISKITVHHTGGKIGVEALGQVFLPTARQASSNYGIGFDGRIGLYVPENTRAWTSSSWQNDNRAVTIEVSNSASGGEWPVSDYVLDRLVELMVDICKRNGMPGLTYDGTPNGSLTEHRMFAATPCPGPYLHERMGALAKIVTAKVKGLPSPPDSFDQKETSPQEVYRVQLGAFYAKSGAERTLEVYDKILALPEVKALLKPLKLDNTKPYIP